jgi:stage V sporulation protein G
MENCFVSEINLAPVRPQNGLVSFASCIIYDSFYIGNIAIYTSPAHSLGYRLVFPTKKLTSGQQLPCVYPFRKESEEIITAAIVNKYLELMGNFNHVNN